MSVTYVVFRRPSRIVRAQKDLFAAIVLAMMFPNVCTYLSAADAWMAVWGEAYTPSEVIEFPHRRTRESRVA
jgi:hypothetical protein